MEGKSEDQQHEAGGREQRHGQHRVGAPGGKRRLARLDDDDAPGIALERPDRNENFGAVRSTDLGDLAVRIEIAAEEVRERAFDSHRRQGLGCPDRAAGVDQQDGAIERHCALRDGAGERALRELGSLGNAVRYQRIEPVGDHVGEGFDVVGGSRECLAIAVMALDEGADPHGEQKRQDQCGDCTAKRRLGGQQTAISRPCDRLSKSLDGIWT